MSSTVFTSAVRRCTGRQTRCQQCDAWLAASASSAELHCGICRQLSLLTRRKIIQCRRALKQLRKPSVTWRTSADSAEDVQQGLRVIYVETTYTELRCRRQMLCVIEYFAKSLKVIRNDTEKGVNPY